MDNSLSELLEALAVPALVCDPELHVLRLNSRLKQWLGVKRALGLRLRDVLDETISSSALRVLRGAQGLELKQYRLTLGDHQHVVDVELDRLTLWPGCALLLQLLPRPENDPLSAHLWTRALAHELRNPLGGMRGAVQLLQGSRLLGSDQACLDILAQELQRLQRLVDGLLTPAVPSLREPLNIHRVTERVIELLGHEFPAMQWRRDYDPSLPELVVSADRLTQALLNLARNAAQNGASKVTLRTRFERQMRVGNQLHRKGLRVDIEDDGPGLPEEVRAQLFVPFVSGRRDGTGLGLPLSLLVAKEHAGTIEWQSQPRRTIFSLLLPQPG